MEKWKEVRGFGFFEKREGGKKKMRRGKERCPTLMKYTIQYKIEGGREREREEGRMEICQTKAL